MIFFENSKLRTVFLNKNLGGSQRYTAFTLAEVLITLGIIGIVAAMTIPTLLQNQQKATTETQLKKAYSIMTQFFKLYMANEGCNDLACTGFFNLSISDSAWQTNADLLVRKHFNVVKSCINGDTSCTENVKYIKGAATSSDFSITKPTFITADGLKFRISNNGCQNNAFPDSTTKYKVKCGGILVDLNSDNPPNTYGKDIFFIGGISTTGEIYPDTNLEWSRANYGDDTHTWKELPGQCGDEGKTTSASSAASFSGQNCLARIMDNNWVIDYWN